MSAHEESTPIEALAILVELVEDATDAEEDAGRVSRAWHAYLKRRWPKDKRELVDDPRVDDLLMRLREGGKGWPTKVQMLARALQRLRKAKHKGWRVYTPGDEPENDPRDPEVVRGLVMTTGERPRPKATLRNVAHILLTDQRWQDAIAYNAFTGDVEVNREPLRDEVTTGLSIWMDEVYELTASSRMTDEAVRYAARENEYHPVRDWLTGLAWDGRPRVEDLLARYLAADDTELHAALSRCFMVSMVARVFVPGCKVDTMLILQGAQGAFKSTALKTLAGRSWFSDTPLAAGKDVFAQIRGKWLYEVQEVDAVFTSRDANAMKALMSSGRDRYRGAYARNMVDQDRQMVFCGTTNAEQFLVDPSGSRRYHPVCVGATAVLDLKALARDRAQLWAEAVRMFHTGTPWWLTNEQADELAASSAQFQKGDVWTGPIFRWLGAHPEKRAGFTLDEVLAGLNIPTDRHNSRSEARAAAVIKSVGGFQRRRRWNGRRMSVWEVPAGWDKPQADEQ